MTDAPYFDVTLMAVEADVDIVIYRGDMMHEKRTLRAGEMTVSYIEQAAMHLGWDVLNKGLSGSCMCEEAIAEGLAALDVDVLSLEIGVNMLVPFDEEAFARERAACLRR